MPLLAALADLALLRAVVAERRTGFRSESGTARSGPADTRSTSTPRIGRDPQRWPSPDAGATGTRKISGAQPRELRAYRADYIALVAQIAKEEGLTRTSAMDDLSRFSERVWDAQRHCAGLPVDVAGRAPDRTTSTRGDRAAVAVRRTWTR